MGHKNSRGTSSPPSIAPAVWVLLLLLVVLAAATIPIKGKARRSQFHSYLVSRD
jgi:hypothetical protein